MRLPPARGPLSELLAERLPGRAFGGLPGDPPLGAADPLDCDDLQLAIFICHELAYGGFDEVSDDWELDPSLLGFRAALERAMLERLFEQVGPPRPAPANEVGARLFALVGADDGPPLARFVQARADLGQVREFVIHRSAYQLKEADPHTFGIPRITGAPKAAMVEIQADEYGGGDAARMHSRLFASTMAELGLDPAYGAYLDRIPGSTLAGLNLISLFGLRRRWRAALVGHLAAFEIGSPEPNRRYGAGLRRLGLGPAATEFFDEHVEADSVHENIAAYDLAGGLAAAEPQLAGEILFGARALLECERRFAGRLLASWERGSSSLLGADLAAAA